MALNSISHVFRGKRYKVEFVAHSRLQDQDTKDKDMVCCGKCEPPDKKDRRILIDKTLTGQDKLRVLIHEALHASDFSIPEDLVDEISTDIASFLHKIGYKQD